MNYNEVVNYINSIPKFTKKNSMSHTQGFMELLGIQEVNKDHIIMDRKEMKIIHVAGTNGKGSTCAYMNEILCALGEKVGLFTSPHLEEMTERIRINGEEISPLEFVAVFQEVMDVVETMKKDGIPHPTFFEFLLGMGMKAFAWAELTYVILETGLGGTLDSTNVFPAPIATVITSIGLDHQQYLGNTIEEIAMEKAGIIKKNIPVIYHGYNEKVSEIIEKKALDLGCLCRKVSDSAYEIQEKTMKYIAFYMNASYDKKDLCSFNRENEILWKMKNKGEYQVHNGVLALMTLEVILCNKAQSSLGIFHENMEEFHIWKQALYETVWPGRMEEVRRNIFLDGAHNIPAIEAVTQDQGPLDVVLFGAVSDKNYHEMIERLTRNLNTKAYVVTTVEGDRGMPASVLGTLFSEYTDKPVYIEEDLTDAWEKVLELKEENGKVLCLGSLYLVGMLKRLISKL